MWVVWPIFRGLALLLFSLNLALGQASLSLSFSHFLFYFSLLYYHLQVMMNSAGLAILQRLRPNCRIEDDEEDSNMARHTHRSTSHHRRLDNIAAALSAVSLDSSSRRTTSRRPPPSHFVAHNTASMMCYLWFNNGTSDFESARLQFVPSPAFVDFLHKLLTTTQVSQSVIVLALHYVYRLKKSNPYIKGKEGSELRLAVTALILANKFLDDNTYTNKTWSDISSISLLEINQMEREFLQGVDNRLYVDVATYESWLQLLHGLLAAKERDYEHFRRRAVSGASSVAIPSTYDHHYPIQSSVNSRSVQSAQQQNLYRTDRHHVPPPPSQYPTSSSSRARSSSPHHRNYHHHHHHQPDSTYQFTFTLPPLQQQYEQPRNPFLQPKPEVPPQPMPLATTGGKRSARDAFSPTSASKNIPPSKRPLSMSIVEVARPVPHIHEQPQGYVTDDGYLHPPSYSVPSQAQYRRGSTRSTESMSTSENSSESSAAEDDDEDDSAEDEEMDADEDDVLGEVQVVKSMNTGTLVESCRVDEKWLHEGHPQYLTFNALSASPLNPYPEDEPAEHAAKTRRGRYQQQTIKVESPLPPRHHHHHLPSIHWSQSANYPPQQTLSFSQQQPFRLPSSQQQQPPSQAQQSHAIGATATTTPGPSSRKVVQLTPVRPSTAKTETRHPGTTPFPSQHSATSPYTRPDVQVIPPPNYHVAQHGGQMNVDRDTIYLPPIQSAPPAPRASEHYTIPPPPQPSHQHQQQYIPPPVTNSRFANAGPPGYQWKATTSVASTAYPTPYATPVGGHRGAFDSRYATSPQQAWHVQSAYTSPVVKSGSGPDRWRHEPHYPQSYSHQPGPHYQPISNVSMADQQQRPRQAPTTPVDAGHVAGGHAYRSGDLPYNGSNTSWSPVARGRRM
ncbi:hypothetical protein FRC03_000623 [Tulasnella sp. 419]|nr:hypothetical protein FRC03_000623 [Tulasnella sp. 419]